MVDIEILVTAKIRDCGEENKEFLYEDLKDELEKCMEDFAGEPNARKGMYFFLEDVDHEVTFSDEGNYEFVESPKPICVRCSKNGTSECKKADINLSKPRNPNQQNSKHHTEDDVMKEINFRGKLPTGEWVYGNLTILTKKYLNNNPGSFISNSAGKPFAFRVIPETVGQYIGVKDKHNVKIYHGDKLQMFRHSDDVGKHIPNKVWEDGKYHPDIRIVRFKLGAFYTFGEYGIEISFMHLARPGESYEIIGNIHDNEPQKSLHGFVELES